MIELFDFMVDLCNKLVNMMASPRIAVYLGGAPFIYVLIAFFVVWVITNIFIIRPFVGGLFYDRGIKLYVKGGNKSSSASGSENGGDTK